MTNSAGPEPAAPPEARPPRRMIVRALLRAVGSTIALVAIYYLLPLDRSATWAAVMMLAIGLVVLIGLVAFQVRSIISSPFPGLRAVEALELIGDADARAALAELARGPMLPFLAEEVRASLRRLDARP